MRLVDLLRIFLELRLVKQLLIHSVKRMSLKKQETNQIYSNNCFLTLKTYQKGNDQCFADVKNLLHTEHLGLVVKTQSANRHA